MKPEVGQQAPDFTAEVVGEGYGEGKTVRLSDLRGGRVVLFFYPKDLTPGCTMQACALRDSWAELAGRAKVFGVSVDDAASHRKFVEKKDLPFPLLCDPDKRLVRAYGVWVEKSMFGRKYFGTERSTFVIGADGRIEAVLEKVSPRKHLHDLLEVLG